MPFYARFGEAERVTVVGTNGSKTPLYVNTRLPMLGLLTHAHVGIARRDDKLTQVSDLQKAVFFIILRRSEDRALPGLMPSRAMYGKRNATAWERVVF